MKDCLFIWVLCCFFMATGAERLADGQQGVFSSEGGRLAFQRATPSGFRLCVMDLATRSVEEVTAKGDAVYPAWGRDGELVYALYDDSETAYEAFRSKSRAGCHLWIRKGGLTRRLTHGRWRDYTPTVSPDGRTIYYSSTQGESALPGNGAQRGVNIRAISMTGGLSRVVHAFSGPQHAAVQPSLSPDGSLMVWAQISSMRENWGIVVARAENPERACRLTPLEMAAYAPRWLPDGRRIVCAAYRAGDPGWCVYLLEPIEGACRRLAVGKNPAVSPDGKTFVYDRDGGLYRADLAACLKASQCIRLPPDSIQAAVLASPCEPDVSVSPPALPFKMTLPASAAYADASFYVACDVSLTEKPSSAAVLVRGVYGEHPLAYQLFVRPDGMCEFALRERDGRYVGLTDGTALPKGTRVRVVGVRTGGMMWLFRDGKLIGTRRATSGSFLAPCRPDRLIAGERLPGTVERVTVGRGWPAEVPKPPTATDLFTEGT